MLHHILASLEQAFRDASFLTGVGISYLAGVASNFFGCSYALIPVVLGVIGVASVTSRLKGFFISFLFVLGMCIVYTAIGIAAAWTGTLFQALMLNPLIYLVLAGVFLGCAASLAGIVKIRLPLFSFQYIPKRKSVFSLILLGMVSGLGIVPCNSYVLIPILSLIGVERNLFYGGAALFFFSLGQGTLVIVLGTFTSLIRRLPKSGSWLIIIHKILAAVLCIGGLMYLWRFFALLGSNT
ncbi:MAG: hypothetical protein GF333_06460 [Candidatus Omnitrophica bacterium]|nr:hypothetical protein [Candidatus Omnitrophota bacterium]